MSRRKGNRILMIQFIFNHYKIHIITSMIYVLNIDIIGMHTYLYTLNIGH